MKLFIICFLIHNILADLHKHESTDINDDHLDPLNYDYDSTNTQEKDKRTIFPQTVEINNWAKHYGISPSGKRVVLGYGPVGLKHVPVIKPITIKHRIKQHHHIISRPPVIQLKPFRPSIQLKPSTGGWKPIVPVRPVVVPSKPLVPVHVPPPHIIRPLPPHHHHDIHVHDLHHHHHDLHHDLHHHHHDLHHDLHHHDLHLHHNHLHGHVDVHHDIQNQIHHAIVHGPHLHSGVHHVDVPVHVGKPVPVVPVAHPVVAPAVKPFIPSPALFEVTKPNLGVLPLGATFPSPVLQDLHLHHIKAAPLLPAVHNHLVPHAHPHAHLVPEPVHNHLVPQPVHNHLVPAVHSHLIPAPHNHLVQEPVHSHLVQEPVHNHLIPQPAHGHLVPSPHSHLIPSVHNHVAPEPLHGHAFPEPVQNHFVPQPVPNHVHNPPGTVVEYHGTRHFVPVNGHAAPEGYPGIQNPAGTTAHEQHEVQTPYLPANHPVFQQAPSNEAQFHQQYPQQFPDPQQINYQPQFQQEVPNIQGHFQQLAQGSGQSIQPGLTDLQFPLHLPQHPGFGHQFISKRNDQVEGDQKKLSNNNLKDEKLNDEKSNQDNKEESYEEIDQDKSVNKEDGFDSYENDDTRQEDPAKDRKE